jgi:DNA-binding NtrC family response regulator
MKNKILIIDDDTGLCELLVSYLAGEGFAAETTHDGAQGADLALSGNFALVVWRNGCGEKHPGRGAGAGNQAASSAPALK